MTATSTAPQFDNFFTGDPREGYGEEEYFEQPDDTQGAGIEEESPADYLRSDGRPD